MAGYGWAGKPSDTHDTQPYPEKLRATQLHPELLPSHTQNHSAHRAPSTQKTVNLPVDSPHAIG